MTSRAPRCERTALLAIAFTISFILRPHARSVEKLHGGKGETRLVSGCAVVAVRRTDDHRQLTSSGM